MLGCLNDATSTEFFDSCDVSIGINKKLKTVFLEQLKQVFTFPVHSAVGRRLTLKHGDRIQFFTMQTTHLSSVSLRGKLKQSQTSSVCSEQQKKWVMKRRSDLSKHSAAWSRVWDTKIRQQRMSCCWKAGVIIKIKRCCRRGKRRGFWETESNDALLSALWSALIYKTCHRTTAAAAQRIHKRHLMPFKGSSVWLWSSPVWRLQTQTSNGHLTPRLLAVCMLMLQETDTVINTSGSEREPLQALEKRDVRRNCSRLNESLKLKQTRPELKFAK